MDLVIFLSWVINFRYNFYSPKIIYLSSEIFVLLVGPIFYFWSFFSLIPPHVSCFWLILLWDEGWWQFLFLFLLLLTQKQNKKQTFYLFGDGGGKTSWDGCCIFFLLFSLLFCKRLWYLLLCAISFNHHYHSEQEEDLRKMAQKSFFYIIRFPCDFSYALLFSVFLYIFIVLEKEANLIFKRRWKYSCNIRYYVCHPTFKGKSNHCERENDTFYMTM